MTPTVPITDTNPQRPQEPAQGPQEGNPPASPSAEPQESVEQAREAVEQAREAVDRETEGTPTGTGDVASVRREAAGYRRRLRETERERDGLRERVDRLDRAEVERLAAARFTDPGDVWLATSIDAMRGEDGLVSDELVTAELARIAKERPHWSKRGPDLHQGPRPNPPQAPSFGEALKQGGRR